MKVRYLDLSVSNPDLRSQLLEAVEKVLTHGELILGPEVREFERRLAEYCGRKFAVGVSSGTDALYMALRALDVGPGDEVITTPLSWIATVNSVVVAGATPVFVDVGPDLNINPQLIEQAITPRTKAILPVHFTGKMCEMDKIGAIAARHGITIIEDAAQAFGAQSPNGQRAGSIGRLACFSMNSMKVLHSYGEAGAILTDEEALAGKMVSLRYGGTVNREDCRYPSLNFRLQTLQAALLLVELGRFDRIVERRREIARFYAEHLKDVVVCPVEEPGSVHVYYTYTIQTERRDELMQFLGSKGIETKIRHALLMPYHTAYRERFKPNIPVAEGLVKRILCLPVHEKMTEIEVEFVAGSILEFFGRKRSKLTKSPLAASLIGN